MKKNILKVFALALVLSVLFVGCGGAASSSSQAAAPASTAESTAESAPDAGTSTIPYLRMASGTQGASWFPIGSAMMDMLGKEFDGIATSNGPGGTVANGKQVNNGEFELGWMNTAVSYDAYNGLNAFEEDGEQSNLRHLLSLFPMSHHIVVRADSDITDLSQIGDKMVNFTPATEAGYLVNQKIIEAYGWDADTIASNGGAVLEVRFNEAAELIKNNQLDVWTALVTPPSSVVSDMAFQPGIRFLELTGDKRDATLANLPGYLPLTIPGGTYEGVPDDVETIGTIAHIVVSADVPDDIVYKILETFEANWADIQAINPGALGDTTPEMWLDGNQIPVHPGAEAFYKEKGMM